MKKQGRYSNEFKDEVLRMAETTGKSLSELEQDLGVSSSGYYAWRASDPGRVVSARATMRA